MIGVKFCGGCNPQYDRLQFLEDIKSEFSGRAEFELAREGFDYEGLLVLGGCPNCCAAYKQYTTATAPVLVWERNHYAETAAKIGRIKE